MFDTCAIFIKLFKKINEPADRVKRFEIIIIFGEGEQIALKSIEDMVFFESVFVDSSTD